MYALDTGVFVLEQDVSVRWERAFALETLYI